MNIDELRHKALLLPLEPGCYLMKDRSGEIIYVGKAKALKNRVVSYFRENSSHNEKTKKMVSCVSDFDFIVTGSEFEALVLECSLIKHYRPKYNILLMDDKGYHYIHVTDEPYPRIEAVLQKPQDNGLLIGPYMSAYVVRETAEQVNQVFMLPTCGRKFPQDFRKARPCLNFHIKRCMGLCQGKVSREAYQKIIDEAVNYIRSGNVASVEELESQMYAASDALDFERAARLRDQISAIRKITERQTVILGEDRQMDAWGFAQNGTLVSCVLLKIREGRIADKENFTFDGEGNVPEVREEFIYRYYTGRKDIPKAVVLDAPAWRFNAVMRWRRSFPRGANGKSSPIWRSITPANSLPIRSDAPAGRSRRSKNCKSCWGLRQHRSISKPTTSVTGGRPDGLAG